MMSESTDIETVAGYLITVVFNGTTGTAVLYCGEVVAECPDTALQKLVDDLRPQYVESPMRLIGPITVTLEPVQIPVRRDDA
jgi:hypothetical protein